MRDSFFSCPIDVWRYVQPADGHVVDMFTIEYAWLGGYVQSVDMFKFGFVQSWICLVSGYVPSVDMFKFGYVQSWTCSNWICSVWICSVWIC